MHDQNTTIALEDLVPCRLEHLARLAPLVPITTEDGLVLERFLRFAISPDLQMLLPVSAIAEVQKLALADVLPVPHVPAWVLGLHYQHGEPLWVIDFAHLLGHSLLYQVGYPLMTRMLIVLDTEGQRLGLMVADVYDIELHDPDRFQSRMPASISSQLIPLVAGYDADLELILLNPQHIVDPETLVPSLPQTEPLTT
jgi:positive phototaxis protein PixI